MGPKRPLEVPRKEFVRDVEHYLWEGHGDGGDHAHAAQGHHGKGHGVTPGDVLEIGVLHLADQILQPGDVLGAVLVAQHVRVVVGDPRGQPRRQGVAGLGHVVDVGGVIRRDHLIEELVRQT